MLPNLSLLKIDARWERRTRDSWARSRIAIDTGPPPTPPEFYQGFAADGYSDNDDKSLRVRLQDVDWVELHNQLGEYSGDEVPLEFVAYVPMVNAPWWDEWKLTFSTTGRKAQLLTNDADGNETCVRVLMEHDATYLDSLFYDIDDETLMSCDIFPAALGSKWSQKGYGDAVMQVFDVIANARGKPVTLIDAAVFKDGQAPLVNVSDAMTTTLVLLRGFGYYESRGFVSSALAKSPEKETYADATCVDLHWSHMITTTPVNKLPGAIQGFHKEVLRLVPSLPAFSRELYSEAFCQRHAARAETRFMKKWNAHMAPLLKAGDEKHRGLDGVSYSALSMRELAQATIAKRVPEDVFDASLLNVFVSLLMKEVWDRPLTLNEDGNPDSSYPGESLVKVLHESSSSDTPAFNAIIPNQRFPGGVPIVRSQPISTDVTVVFPSVPRDEWPMVDAS